MAKETPSEIYKDGVDTKEGEKSCIHDLAVWHCETLYQMLCFIKDVVEKFQ